MATGKTTERRPLRAQAPPASYLRLIRRFPLRPIQSEAELDRATAVMNELLDRGELDPAEDDYLDVLSDLVERYEEKAHPIPDVSEGEMLAFLIEQKDVKQVDVARGAGLAESTLSEVRAGKRRLTRGQVEKLARYFRVGPEVFLQAGEKKDVRGL